ncbi:MAG TPA: adenylate/guanylate cyclase domain-containing protein [Candidatus Binatia bacterium]|nr:adenylate/guanylate cyclase domain-containing protein [Candidatus Binatia bacterium]
MKQEQLPRKLSAILHADVAGYSRLTGEDEEGTHRRVSAYLDAITAITERYHGNVLNYAGDAVLADFPTVSDALTCAAAIQHELRQRNQELPENQKIQFRIGVNLGEVIVDRGEIFGDGVNIAARLEALAEPGGVCISGAVYDAMGSKLPIDYQFLGEQQVKNIAKPIRVYRAQLRPGVELPPPRVNARIRQPKRYAVAVAVAVALIIMVGVIAWFASRSSKTGAEKPATLPSTQKPSVAVLPFTNLSNDPQQEYFSDGITNDIITDLSRFSSLFVIASNSVFAYKGKPIKVQDVGRELGVRYLLEGSIQRANDKVRVNAQLVDANTGQHMWAERYERNLKDVFVVQDEIVRSIVGALAVRVRDVERNRAMRKDTDSLEAYDYVLRGREYLSRITRSTNLEARTMFQKAIEADQRYAAAYVGLGWTYRRAVGHGWTEFVDEALERAQDLAQEALRLEDSAAAHGLLASVYLMREQYELAGHAAERAIELNPSDSDSLSRLASVLLYTGRTDEAVRAYETALRFDPSSDADILFTLGLAYYLQSRYEQAIRILEQGRAKNPNHPFIHAALAGAYAKVERSREAAREADRVRRLYPFFEVESFGTRFRNPQDRDRIAEGLRKAGLN